MSRSPRLLVAALASAITLIAGPIGDPPLTGQRTASADIVGTGGWFDDFVVSWAITPEGLNYRYTYTFNSATTARGSGSISHWVMQLSSNCWDGASASFTSCMFDPTLGGNPIAASDIELKTHTEQQGNPGMPANIFGVKFDIGWEFENGPAVFSFLSDRQPMWGDFYVKGGQATAYNRGMDNPASTNVNFFLATPDTKRVNPIPEPGSIALFGAGLLALGYVHRRRRR